MDTGLKGRKIGFLGGDVREIYLIQGLLNRGAVVTTLGKPPGALRVKVVEDPVQVIEENEVVIAPMSSTDEKGYIKATFSGHTVCLNEDLLQYFKPGQLFLIGVIRPGVKKVLDGYRINYVQLAARDDLAILNAIPTAEGVIKIAIEETDFTLFNARCLIFGLGRCGLTLAHRLKALGSRVYGVTRNPRNRAWGENFGIEMVGYQELEGLLPQMDLVINTVPAMVLAESRLKLLKKNALIIDIASDPGGVDYNVAEKLGIKAILALGLPGKIAPRTSGEILIQLVPQVIGEFFS